MKQTIKIMLIGITLVLSGTILFSSNYVVNMVVGSMPVNFAGNEQYTKYALFFISLGIIFLLIGLLKKD